MVGRCASTHPNHDLDMSSALINAILVGTTLQLAMVITGHYNKGIANLFAVLGMTISLIAGLLYALWAKQPSLGADALGGLLAGGICALIGIIVSYALRDVQAVIILFGTLSSAITGAIGGAVGHVIASKMLR
jgi:hypothetical protein